MANPVKVLRKLLNDPDMRSACDIPEDAEIDEGALDELELWCVMNASIRLTTNLFISF